MSVAYFMEEAYALKNLFEKGLDEFEREASVVVLFDEFVEWGAEGLEDETVILVVVEWFFIADNSFLVFLIPFVDVLDDVFFNFGWLYIFLDWADDLDRTRATLMA